MQNFTIHSFWLQKLGNLASEYEDAYDQVPPGQCIEAGSCWLAIADGASESSFANIWAKQLVRSYCGDPFYDLIDFKERISLLGNRWHQIVFRKPMAWFAETKAQMGAFATFLGLEISTQKNHKFGNGGWRAIAIGDSCLFQIHRDEIHIAWPMVHSESFGNSPNLVASYPSQNVSVWQHVRFQQGIWHKGDLIILATDALAAWFLKETEDDHKPWNELAAFTKKPDPYVSFCEWAAKNRAEKTLRNDDITCLIIETG